MASDRRSSMSSAFDDMLEQNRKELDSMYSSSPHDPRPQNDSAEPRAPAFPSTNFEVRGSSQTEERSAAQQLRERFGDKWRYEVTSRQRDGDEVVVLCKLMLLEQHVTKAQFGLARIGSAGAGSLVQGSACGVSFSLGASDANSMSGDTEDAAYARAVEDALAKCAAML